MREDDSVTITVSSTGISPLNPSVKGGGTVTFELASGTSGSATVTFNTPSYWLINNQPTPSITLDATNTSQTLTLSTLCKLGEHHFKVTLPSKGEEEPVNGEVDVTSDPTEEDKGR